MNEALMVVVSALLGASQAFALFAYAVLARQEGAVVGREASGCIRFFRLQACHALFSTTGYRVCRLARRAFRSIGVSGAWARSSQVGAR